MVRVNSGSGVGVALSEPHSVRGYGSKRWGGIVDAEEEICINVKMMCWNVAGWARGDVNDEGVQSVYRGT